MREVADNIVDVDRAMRWGFAWELGPFEMVDRNRDSLHSPRKSKKKAARFPPFLKRCWPVAAPAFTNPARGENLGLRPRQPAKTKKAEEPAGILILKTLKGAGREVERNSGASLIDLGDGVVCCEFHSKMNAIGADLIAMIHKGIKRLETDFDAMVIANQATNFSVGANLMLVLVGAQEQEWDELHMAVKQFQNINLAIKYAPKPVVAAPQGHGTLAAVAKSACTPQKIHSAAESLYRPRRKSASA